MFDAWEGGFGGLGDVDVRGKGSVGLVMFEALGAGLVGCVCVGGVCQVCVLGGCVCVCVCRSSAGSARS